MIGPRCLCQNMIASLVARKKTLQCWPKVIKLFLGGLYALVLKATEFKIVKHFCPSLIFASNAKAKSSGVIEVLEPDKQAPTFTHKY
jgi:hypothetical protein